MKAVGSLSNFWVIRWAHISDLEFNDQYALLYLNMARNNIHQPLSTSRDVSYKHLTLLRPPLCRSLLSPYSSPITQSLSLPS